MRGQQAFWHVQNLLSTLLEPSGFIWYLKWNNFYFPNFLSTASHGAWVDLRPKNINAETLPLFKIQKKIPYWAVGKFWLKASPSSSDLYISSLSIKSDYWMRNVQFCLLRKNRFRRLIMDRGKEASKEINMDFAPGGTNRDFAPGFKGKNRSKKHVTFFLLKVSLPILEMSATIFLSLSLSFL